MILGTLIYLFLIKGELIFLSLKSFYSGIRFSLDPASLSALEVELERMLDLGYGWRHPYTQCTIQSLLQAIQYE